MPFAPNSPHARDIAYHLHPYTNPHQHEETGPLVMEKADGIYMTDAEGKRYLEGFAGLWCTSLGWGEKRLIDAATTQLVAMAYTHSFGHRSHNPAIDLAKRLVKLAPVPMSKVWFANSGSEANDTAVKIIWYYNNALGRPKKKKLIARHLSYHGVTVAAGSLTGFPAARAGFDPLPGFLHTDCPHYYHGAEPGESEEDFASRLARNLDEMIVAEDPDTVAAFFAEPVMGSGGVIIPPKTYFTKVQQVLKKHDILFVADEVICGFGRTGNMFGTQTFNLTPDIMVMAKGLSSAYLPISAVMISEQVYQGVAKGADEHGIFGTGYTYSGHPVCAAVALEATKIYEERNIAQHVREVGAHLLERLKPLEDHPLVGEVRSIGLMAAVELVRDKAKRENFEPGQKVAAYCADRSREHGVIVRPLPNDSVAISPPLIITKEQIDELVEGLVMAIEDTERWVEQEKLRVIQR